VADQDRSSGLSAAWGVVAVVTGAGAFTVWSTAHSPGSRFPIWPAYGFCAVAVIALYLTFALPLGLWPARARRPTPIGQSELLPAARQMRKPAGDASSAARKVGVAPLSADGRQAEPATWPSPDAIRTVEDYEFILRRTWIRAGTPAHDEIERRAGGLLSSQASESLITEGQQWDDERYTQSLLFIEACGLPEDLIQRWRDAGARLRRTEGPLNKWNRHWRVKVFGCCLVGAGIFFAVALGIVQISARPHLSADHWWGVAASSLIIGLILLVAVESALVWLEPSYKVLSISGMMIFCLAGFLAGWYEVRHAGAASRVDLAHAGLYIRNWLAWRF
jgi:hypothetical protein